LRTSAVSDRAEVPGKQGAKLKKRAIIAGVCVALGVCTPSIAAVNLVVNGDFSEPGVSGGWTNSAVVPGWTNLTETYVDVGASPIYDLSCDNAACQSMEVNNNGIDAVAQTISGLVVGERIIWTGPMAVVPAAACNSST
jgi:hypothetical protein